MDDEQKGRLMSLHDWTTRRTTAWTEEDYLHADVDAKAAASLLQVSASRWRQITGSRAGTPDPIIGPGRTEPGQRGARWPLYRVLQYAMSTGRELHSATPPLLPHPDGRPRYSSTSSQSVRTTKSSAGSSTGVTAWADLYHPVDPQMCGHSETSVLVLTPTWPTTTWSMIPVLQPLVGAALTSQAWGLERADQLTIVIALVDEGTYGRFAHSDLMTYEVGPEWLEAARKTHTEATASPLGGTHFAELRTQVPAKDVAESLGHVLPWWPYGTPTSSTCPRWAPGRPVTVTVPAGDAGRLEAAEWLQQPGIIRPQPFQPRPAELLDAPLDQQALRLAAMVQPTPSLKDMQPPMETSELAEGLEVAARIVWPHAITSTPSIDPWPLLDTLLGDEDGVPPHIADQLHAYFGDPRYAPLAQIDLRLLPDLWATLFHQQAAQSPATPTRSERWRRLDAATIAGAATTLGPQKSPAIIEEAAITWLPPTGHQTVGPEAPAHALPTPQDGPHEVLLARETLNGWIRGWVRTHKGNLIPLPARTQTDMGTHGDAAILIAALTNQNPQVLYEQSANATIADPIDDSAILHLLRSVTDEPLTLTWTELQALAHD